MVLREDLIRHYRWLRQYGLNDSHSGNASVRDGERVWITPTGACADLLEPQQLVQCSVDGSRGQGASLDAPLHIEVYRRNPKATAVVHSHGAHTVAMTMNGNDFLPIDFEGQLYFPRVPVLTIAYERYITESPAKVAALLAEYPLVVVRGHGVYACAESLNLAYKWSCSLELSAKTAWLAQLARTSDEGRGTRG